jgi:hypothetical protein
MITGAGLIAAVSSGCASFGTWNNPPGGAQAGSSLRRPSEQIIKADPHTGDPLTALEQELTKVHSDRVIVSSALLRSLVRNERLQQNQCKHISGQLEAIKNIDLEETGGSGANPGNPDGGSKE